MVLTRILHPYVIFCKTIPAVPKKSTNINISNVTKFICSLALSLIFPVFYWLYNSYQYHMKSYKRNLGNKNRRSLRNTKIWNLFILLRLQCWLNQCVPICIIYIIHATIKCLNMWIAPGITHGSSEYDSFFSTHLWSVVGVRKPSVRRGELKNQRITFP